MRAREISRALLFVPGAVFGADPVIISQEVVIPTRSPGLGARRNLLRCSWRYYTLPKASQNPSTTSLICTTLGALEYFRSSAMNSGAVALNALCISA
jgi:hypothetical protein